LLLLAVFLPGALGRDFEEDAMSANDPHSHVMDALSHGKPIEAQYVRQARVSMRVVWVLAVSLALAALATFGMWLAHAPRLAAPGSQQAVSGRSFRQPLPVARQTVSQDPTAARRGSR
jgi:hypothetical protein